MPRTLVTRTMCSLAALSFALPAMADISPDDLWQKWQSDSAASGRSVTAQTVHSDGDDLRLENVTITQVVDDGTLTAQMDQLLLRNADNASVAVIIGPDQKLRFSVKDSDEDIAALFNLSGNDLILAVTGDIAAPDYAFASIGFTLDLEEATDNGVPVETDVQLGFKEISGTVEGTDLSSGAPLIAAFKGAEATAKIDFSDAESGFSSRSATAQADFTSALTLDPGTNADSKGWAVSGKFAGGMGQSSSYQKAPETGVIETNTSQESSMIDFTLDTTRATYDIAIIGAETSISSDQFPVKPLTIRLPEASAKISFPTAQSEDAQPANLRVNLSDVELDDGIWNLADPSGAIPRTPLQLALDMDVEILVQDNPVLAGPEGMPPMPSILPQAVGLRDLTLAVADAAVQASGVFAFETPEGSPVPNYSAPIGSMDISGSGIMQLLQRLEAAGLLDAQQSMGAQMMLGMFATPGEGDTLTSKIVAEPGGGLVVNGNRMR